MSADWRSAAFSLLLLHGAAAQAAEPETDVPSDALLEFLGSFETDDGEWLDPLALVPADDEGAERIDDDPANPDEA